MKPMSLSAGWSFLIIGIIMIIFHRPLGVWILKFAKKSFSNAEFPSYVPKELIERKIKNINKTNGPFGILFMGIVFIVEGIFFLILAIAGGH